ncbi:DapH/DapD/GlmU-related protein [Nanchangia anserum]|uniref:2,3,4,5-tetrahydropyridine-2,6-dicarboxylate N-succinyltransferase n=1 Tax=Nanchangia anserum TaxID=2692125 RepID=A0A8I0GDE5_9ACTO|nr:DapH/DapD/GlmU-related protein [Nanchangia anserum]MBD3690100.1 2,3,4,5-tetrahydropyridine-2,6-dicarboxylate N-succinyltransferase [Nanchangia anserum]
MSTRTAWGLGLATVTDDGQTLDVWYPEPVLGDKPADGMADLLAELSQIEGPDATRAVHRSVVQVAIDLDTPPQSTADAYLRLHLLSHRLVLPNTINLESLHSRMPNVVWTTEGPAAPEGFEATRRRLRIDRGYPIHVLSVDRFPPMVNYVAPSNVRIAEATKVRLGAYLAPGTTVAASAFVDYNAGTLGAAMIEGRLSRGVTVGEGSDIGGGASTFGVGTGTQTTVALGERCLMGANSGLGIPLGDDCIVEAGLYVTPGTKVTVLPNAGVAPGEDGHFADPAIVSAKDLAGVSNVTFRRNSQTGRVEVLPRSDSKITLDPAAFLG